MVPKVFAFAGQSRRRYGWRRMALGLALVLASAAISLAQQAAPAASPTPAVTPAPPPAPAPLSATEAWIKKTKEPAPFWKWGADLRLRDEFFDNALTLSSAADRHEQNYQRFRLRYWNVVTPAKNVDVTLRLTIESRNWSNTSFSAPFHTGFDFNEVVFDHANVKLKNIGGSPLTLTLGRQDLTFGEGFLIFEGTPLDGSRTIYFDAARASYELKAKKLTLDAIYVDQAARNDRILPPIKLATDDATIGGTTFVIGRKKAQIEHNERGVILYASSKAVSKTQIDGYYIYRQTRREPIRVATAADAGTWTPYEVQTPADDPYMQTNLKRGDESNLHTLGGRVVGELQKVWRYRAELAFQTGDKNGKDQRSLGLNTALMFNPKTKLSHQLRFAYEYLGGDNPGTARDEQFDVLWGRWPRFSELYIYTYAPETRISQLGNLHRVGPGYSFKPTKNTEFVSDFYLMYAVRNNRTAPPGFFSAEGKGKTRGKLLTTIVRHKFGAHLSAHLWGEYFFPGSYYGEARRDTAVFIRAETILTW
jgi:hypothetical protein